MRIVLAVISCPPVLSAWSGSVIQSRIPIAEGLRRDWGIEVYSHPMARLFSPMNRPTPLYVYFLSQLRVQLPNARIPTARNLPVFV
jgi:hypothetical protein